MNTPGVYIKETLTQSAVVAGVSTAVPAFFGYTQLAVNAPVRITGMLDFRTHFGGAHQSEFDITLDTDEQVTAIIPDYRFCLYDTLQLYFQNGGGPCYIISIGTYATHTDGSQQLTPKLQELETLDEVTLVLVPDLHAAYKNSSNQLAPLFDANAYGQMTSIVLNTIAPLQNKFAIFDLPEPTGNAYADAAAFRAAVNPTLLSDLKYGAAYYPWLQLQARPPVTYAQLTLNKSYAGDPLVDAVNQLNTDVQAIQTQYGFVPTQANCWERYHALKDTFVNTPTSRKTKFSAIFKYLYDLVANIDSLSGLATTVSSEIAGLKTDEAMSYNIRALYRFKGILAVHTTPSLLNSGGFSAPGDAAWFNVSGTTDTTVAQVEGDASLLPGYTQLVNGPNNAYQAWADAAQILVDLESGVYVQLDQLFAISDRIWKAVQFKLKLAEQQLMESHPVYSRVKAATEVYLRKTPSQGAVAGAYCTNDRNLGVWRAPANVSLQGVQGPLTDITNADQDGLNHDPGSGKSINAVRTFTGRGTLIWGARTLAANSGEWRYIPVRRFFSFAEAAIKKAAEAFVFAPNHAQTWVQVNAMITSFLVEQWKNGALVGNTFEEAFQVSVGAGSTPGEMDVSVGLAVARPAEFIIVRFSQSMQNA